MEESSGRATEKGSQLLHVAWTEQINKTTCGGIISEYFLNIYSVDPGGQLQVSPIGPEPHDLVSTVETNRQKWPNY